MIAYDKSVNPIPILRKTLNTVNLWLNDHNLAINYNKTKTIQFRSYKYTPINIDTTYNYTQLETLDTFKLLGITIDTHINWIAHIDFIKSKLSRFTYALFQLVLFFFERLFPFYEYT